MAQSALSNMFALLSLAFRNPASQFAELLVSGSFAHDVAETWRLLALPDDVAARFSAAIASACDASCADEALHLLRREHTRLFLGDRPLVTNSEGPWRKKAEGKQGVALMVNSYSLEVADFMRSCGVTRRQGYNDCVDYIENEFDFAALLASGPLVPGTPVDDSLDMLERFIHEHLLLWVPGFCADIERETRSDYYQTLAALTATFMEALAS